MIETKVEITESIFSEAIDQAKKLNNSQLVSITKEILPIEPLHFFNAAKQLDADRTFWSNTAEDFTMVGVGTTYRIEATENRFEETDQQWNRIREQAIIHNPYQKPGTGLVIMGGMTFDPSNTKTALWENFPESEFTVPTYVYSNFEGKHYLTTNVHVSNEDNASELLTNINETINILLKNPVTDPVKAVIVDKQDVAPEKWKQTVKDATNEIKSSVIEKIVLSREIRIKLSCNADITAVVQDLLNTQTNSFVFAFERNGDCFVGATPERLVKIENDHLYSACLAGTAPRGETVEADDILANQLLNDDKNRSEHDFVVKMISEAINPYCTDIVIPEVPTVYPLKNLQHLYTPVTAEVRSNVSVFDIIGKLHPTAALGGVPRHESMEFIRNNELLDRGWYGAPVGWIDHNNNSEFAVAIRSGLLQGDTASLFAGCGVVEDSEPEAEYEETNIKLKPMLTVLGG
ncbi:isochorismate synthase [Virgibacillus flavescens]|uniref:isochorismate synthase n=1 Tax=Virgibacillus flavescens TaxID=1611422 RepID=UPI003D32ADD7